ncbi:alpha/beta fold hydrolase [Salininema proteolyticum]|uniref:Alpha/beta fold hydrolase n=1 Tax=Salininema proteolyticum TaxID=1607685 RepID=A0ABV8TU21_9ACTN
MSTDLWTPTAYADGNGARIAYDTYTPGRGGQPVLLITGLGASRRWFPDGFAQALADKGLHPVRYDNRDSGESTRFDHGSANPLAALFGRRNRPYTCEDTADDAAAVLDALDIDAAHLFGISMGGALAQRTALRHPGRVRTLTTMSSFPGDRFGMKLLKHINLKTARAFRTVDFPDTREGAVQTMLAISRLNASPNAPFDEEAALEQAERVADNGIRDRRAQSRQMNARWHGDPIEKITAPTLVLHGEDDPLVKLSGAEETARRVPGARLHTIPLVGHDLPARCWNEIADRMTGDHEPA